jgi:hypothetical protein
MNDALRLWKTKYQDFKDFKKDVIKHPSLEDFGNFVEEIWDSITQVTIKEALQQENTEIRRTYFDCIGVEKLFQQLQPVLRDRQVITKKRTKWDDNNDPIEYHFNDVYELYEIDGKKLYNKDRFGRDPEPVFAVRCWCTTTNREYWIYVDREAATGNRWFFHNETAKYDAIRAIAWTIRVDVSTNDIDKIYRQGDIIVVKLKKNNFDTHDFRHLTKEEYLKKMYSET